MLFINNAEVFFAQISEDAPTKEEVEAAKAVLDKYEQAVTDTCGKALIRCSCGYSQQVKDSVYIKSFWTSPPHGCTGGNITSFQEGGIICQGCKLRIRFAFKCSALQEHKYEEHYVEILSHHTSGY